MRSAMVRAATPARRTRLEVAALGVVEASSALNLVDDRCRSAIEPAGKLGAEFSDMLQRQTVEKAALQCEYKRNLVR